MKNKYIHKEEVAEHDNGYIHKVVRNQYRCQEAFWIPQQGTYFFVGRMILFINIIPIGRSKWEKSYFGSRSKAGSKQEYTCQYYGNNSRDRRSVYGNTVENVSQLA